jgi:hypothetical protein
MVRMTKHRHPRAIPAITCGVRRLEIQARSSSHRVFLRCTLKGVALPTDTAIVLGSTPCAEATAATTSPRMGPATAGSLLPTVALIRDTRAAALVVELEAVQGEGRHRARTCKYTAMLKFPPLAGG